MEKIGLRRKVAWLKLLTIICYFGCSLTIATVSVRGQDDNSQIPAKTLKDLQQDEHMAYTDSRLGALQNNVTDDVKAFDDVITKRDEQIAKLQVQSSDLEGQITAIKYFGIGAFTVLGVLQTLGLIKQFRGDKKDDEE